MESQLTTFTQSIKAVFNPSRILKLSRKVKFTQKLRTLHPANLVGTLIHALSYQDHANKTKKEAPMTAKMMKAVFGY